MMNNNNNVVRADKTIRFDPAKSVLKYRVGDEIKLNEADFVRLLRPSLLKSKLNTCDTATAVSGRPTRPVGACASEPRRFALERSPSNPLLSGAQQ